MNSPQKLKEHSDSLIGILSAQCLDLEILLNLAQKETVAAERRDFEAILNVVTERASIGRKLETYQTRIAELRGMIGGFEVSSDVEFVLNRIVEVTGQTLVQDKQTKLLLTEAREETAREMRNLATGASGMNAYLREEQRGLSYSESF